MSSRTEPFLLSPGMNAQRCALLPRKHNRFDERFLQELLEEHPGLLPVSNLRPDAGQLVCIGREVPTRDSGELDNLYLSTGGYVVVVETKLWRNPQSRREVLSQILDYIKDIVTRDFEWLESVWKKYRQASGAVPESLTEVIQRQLGNDEEFDERHFIDRVERGLQRGHVIGLIVGDGIDHRLQGLVSHLCRDSSHLRYSLGMVSLRCFGMPNDGDVLVLPELVQDIEPVERAYVRIEVADVLASQVRIVSIAETEDKHPAPGAAKRRTTLSEDSLFDDLAGKFDQEKVGILRQFVNDAAEYGVAPEYKSAAMMLKIADPEGESNGASLLAITRSGHVYNPRHGRKQVERWKWDGAAVDHTIGAYWRSLNALDKRFLTDGISHLRPGDFLPLEDVFPILSRIAEAMKQVAMSIEKEHGSNA